MDTALEPLPTEPQAEVGPLRERAELAAGIIDYHHIPASMVYFYAVEGGYCVTVHCQDVPAMCEALGVELAWKYAPNGKRRHVSVIIEGIEFSGSEECK